MKSGQAFTCPRDLLDFPASLLPVSLAGQRLLDPLLLSRLQVKRVSFDLFDDVLLLDLPLEAPKGILKSFALLESHFSQRKTPPNQYKISLPLADKVLIS